MIRFDYGDPSYDLGWLYLDDSLANVQRARGATARMCDELDTIDLKFSEDGRLWRIEVLNASRLLPVEILTGRARPLLSVDATSDVAELTLGEERGVPLTSVRCGKEPLEFLLSPAFKILKIRIFASSRYLLPSTLAMAG